MKTPPLLLGRYRELERLDAGGYGTVFLAFDERMTRRVAIKVLPLRAAGHSRRSSASNADDSELVAVGLEEARTAALLNHPAIVSIYDFAIDEERGQAFLIMEYVDGLTLAAIPSEDLSFELIAAVAQALGSALSFAHKNGVLHLDIKPSNILIDHEGRVKLADFGLARLSGTGTGLGTGFSTDPGAYTGAGFDPSDASNRAGLALPKRRRQRGGRHGRAVAGTLGYMSLEQLRGDEVSEASDQWALAAVLYELLSDEFPYFEQVAGRGGGWQRTHAISAEALLRAQNAEEAALLELATPELDAAFARALARNPEARFEDVDAFCNTVVEELGGSSAVSCGKQELRALVADLTSDDPDELDAAADEQAAAERQERRARRTQRRAGCARLFGLASKMLAGAALALSATSLAAPQLFGDKQGLVTALSAGVFIIVLAGILVAALWRRRQY
jgi:serine/threonine-protein kinase